MKRPLQWIKRCLREFIDPFKSKGSLPCPTLFLGIASFSVSVTSFVVLLVIRLEVEGFGLWLLVILFCIFRSLDFMYREIYAIERHRKIMDAIEK